MNHSSVRVIVFLLFGVLTFQDVARPVPPDVAWRSPTIYIPVPLVRLNGLLPAPGMIWIEVANPNYIPLPRKPQT